MNTIYRIAAFLVLMTALLHAPVARADNKPDKLFSNNEEWKITLSGPWSTVRSKKSRDARYPATITHTGADGSQHTVNVEVAPRGISRRLRVCKFPPLKVYFDKEQMKGTAWRGNGSLKLVTYCDSSRKYEQYAVKEYLVYRIYNLITEYSFRVQPMMIEYENTEKNTKPLTRFGFFIEDTDDVAKRHELVKLEVPRIPTTDLHSLQTSYFALFQYMVGNLDWAAVGGPDPKECCHNAKLIGTADDAVPKYAIPYDFDSTGLVDAHYAAPPNNLKVRNIRQRMYRGYCAHKDTLVQAAAHFNDRKADITALFEANPHIYSKNRDDAVGYLEGFYEIINDEKDFKRNIIDKCRG